MKSEAVHFSSTPPIVGAIILPHYTIGDKSWYTRIVMERFDLLLILGTFVLGFAAGVYVYFFMYEPHFRFTVTGQDAPQTTFTITGEAYGQCETSNQGCGSFRLLSNRDYRLVFTDTDGTVQQSREGMVSTSLMDEFLRQLNLVYQRDTLDRYPTSPLTCQQEGSGVQYTVDITDVGRYYFDSCAGRVSSSDEIWRALERIGQSFVLR